MSAYHLAILNTGLVTPVGLTAPSSCGAFRAKVTNPTPTRFMAEDGEWIMAHQVALEQPWRGLGKLARMAAMAIEEALAPVSKAEWGGLPLLLCVAEADRRGRMQGLDEQLFSMIQDELGVHFATGSGLIAQGRVAVAVGLAQARLLISRGQATRVLIVAADSLLDWPSLSHFANGYRLLIANNSNGFMPGEAAGALLVGQPRGVAGELVCSGLGFARETAHIDSGEPLRADGLSQAIKAALSEAGLQMHDMDFRITDLSGEQYYFKEATLALSRTMRVLKEAFDIWHPAECTGETGAAAGMSIIAQALEACRKGYTLGPNILAHMSNDAGQRAALSLQYRTAA